MTATGLRARLWMRRVADLVALIKVKQTALLLITGFCAYVLTRRWVFAPGEALWMAGGLFFSISGCTALNMVLDRDVDAHMARTSERPLPTGRIRPAEAASLYMLASSLLLTMGTLGYP